MIKYDINENNDNNDYMMRGQSRAVLCKTILRVKIHQFTKNNQQKDMVDNRHIF